MGGHTVVGDYKLSRPKSEASDSGGRIKRQYFLFSKKIKGYHTVVRDYRHSRPKSEASNGGGLQA
ncbi:hypothetical protein GCM10022210_02680 [Mucilaginibacter dorajii]|uniref:Uncharacterized protein n=1 Tax=Mucilaginibacter dorajii TaxID=692994 RepID=A0ABP7P2S0_9SPHI